MKKSRLRISSEKKHKIIEESFHIDAPAPCDIARKYNIPPQTLYRWRSNYLKENVGLPRAGFVEVKQIRDAVSKLQTICFDFKDYSITVSGKPNAEILNKILAFGNV